MLIVTTSTVADREIAETVVNVGFTTSQIARGSSGAVGVRDGGHAAMTWQQAGTTDR